MKLPMFIMVLLVFLSSCTTVYTACTADAKICPDGSTVGRVAPDCEFAPCPVMQGCTKEAKACPDGSTVGRLGPHCEFAPCPEDTIEKISCTHEQREGEYCITLYKPVCGWFDNSKIQCIRYPCAAQYSNSCFACQDEKVEYYTQGECPA